MPNSRAIVFTEVNQVELQEYDLPDPKPDELVIRTEYSGVSQGTEIWALTGRRPEVRFPVVPGYQSVGVVEVVGPATSGYEVGDKVLFTTSRPPDGFLPSWMGAHVGLALASTSIAHPPVHVPDGVDAVGAALAALPAVGLRGVDMIRVSPDDLVVVNGQGLIGQGVAQLARLRGAIVVASDLSDARLDLSRECGADVIVNPSRESLGEVVRSLRPQGADVVIDTTGRSDQFAPCIDLLRWEGSFLMQGWYPDPVVFDFHATHHKKPTIAVTCGFGPNETTRVLDLMRYGKLRFREVVSHLSPPDEAPAIYARLAAADPDMLGVVFDWTGGAE